MTTSAGLSTEVQAMLEAGLKAFSDHMESEAKKDFESTWEKLQATDEGKRIAFMKGIIEPLYTFAFANGGKVALTRAVESRIT